MRSRARTGGLGWVKVVTVAALLGMVGVAPAGAGTFVYVSNADDGDIGTYTLEPGGTLVPGARVAAAKVVMPMAVSPDRRFLYAGVRSKPYAVHAYSIDAAPGRCGRWRSRRSPRASRTSRSTGRAASSSARPTAPT